MILKKLLSIGLLAVACLFTNKAEAQSDVTFKITFYGENSGARFLSSFTNGVADLPNWVQPQAFDQTRNLKYTLAMGRSDMNDEARSARITTTGPVTIYLYDHPSGTPNNDDYSVIRIHGPVRDYFISSFERNIPGGLATHTWYDDNGLDGKVSSFRITR